MDVKEKLVELLQNAKAAMKSENLSCDIARNMFVVDFMMSNGVTVQEQKSPCSLCGYGGKHLDSPPCTQCPAHPKEQPNANQRNSNASNVQEWIPVTERLPEQDKEVLLIVHGWEDRLYYTGCLHRQEAERSWLTGIESKASDWKIWGFSYFREPIVTHWMPLPEPPKEG